MNTPIPARRFKNGDPSPNGDGLVYWRDTNKKDRWVTPEVLAENKEQANTQVRNWNKKHPGRAKAAFAKWLAKPGKLEMKRGLYRKWHAENPEQRRTITRRYLATVNGMIINRVRSRIAVALNRGHTKSASTLELIGCSIEELKLHLEAQFPPGMSWWNQNLWEIHHRIPLAYFDMSDPKQQREAFSWRNQQPLWIADNRVQTDKMGGELFRAREYRKMRKPKTPNIIPFKEEAA